MTKRRAKAEQPPTARTIANAARLMLWDHFADADTLLTVARRALRRLHLNPAIVAQCHVGVSRATGRGGAASTLARVALEGAEDGFLSGWRVIVVSEHVTPAIAVQTAIRAAALVTRAGRVTSPRRLPPATKVEFATGAESLGTRVNHFLRTRLHG